MRHPLLALAVASAAAVAPALAAAPAPSAAIRAAVADPARSAADRARDPYRHPAETLAFFGVRPTDHVVEVIPGGGWYADILAPLVRGKGRYTPLVSAKGAEKARTTFAAKAARFGAVDVASFAPDGTTTLPAGQADVVLTFRNVHNLLMDGSAPTLAPTMFKGFYAALKPGGTLGIVDHRLPEDMDAAKERTSGYVKRSTILRLATQAGFRLVSESPINANARDTHDWPKGVWTLPPNYAEGDADRARYAAIGESDRLTMRFVKPVR